MTIDNSAEICRNSSCEYSDGCQFNAGQALSFMDSVDIGI